MLFLLVSIAFCDLNLNSYRKIDDTVNNILSNKALNVCTEPSRHTTAQKTVIYSISGNEYSDQSVYECQQAFLSKNFKLTNCILQIYSCNFTNSNSDKSAIYFNSNKISSKLDGNIEINNCRFSNYHSKIGGSLYIFSADSSRSITITKCYFNSQSQERSEKGGSIYINAVSAIISDTQFLNCCSDKGGSIYYTNKNINQYESTDFALKIDKCSFVNNKAQKSGGCVYLSTSKFNSNEPFEIRDCNFTSSTAVNSKSGKGAGIYITSNDPKSKFNVIQCLFGQCSATKGGAIFFNAISGNIQGCTFSNNDADDGFEIAYSYGSKMPNKGEKLTITNNKFVRDSTFHSKKKAAECLIYASLSQHSLIEFTQNRIEIDGSFNKVYVFNYPEGEKFTRRQLKLADNSIPPSIEENIRLSASESEISNSASLLDDASQCEPQETGFTAIGEDGGSIFGNIYACDVNFKGGLSSYMLLHMYSCKFNGMSATAVSIGLDSNHNGDIKIKNTQFTSCSEGGINIQSEKFLNQIYIVECLFEQCAHKNGAGVYLKGAKAEITQCHFLNNYEEDGGDIYYEYVPSVDTATGEKLVINKCTFERKNGASSEGSFVSFSSNSAFDFTENKIRVQSQIKMNVFNWPQDPENPDNLVIERNTMNPFREDILENFIGSKPDSFVEEEPMECPPIPLIYGDLDPSVYIHECEGTHDDEEVGNRGFYSNTLCGIYYTTFYNLQLHNDSFGAAVYITTDQSIPSNLKEPVKIYKCDFSNCKADFGGAVYIQSTEINRLFDINGSTFTLNSNYSIIKSVKDQVDLHKGGAIYINAPQSTIRISDCTFDSNKCEIGGAIYYVSADSSSSSNTPVEGDENTYSLYINDCKFRKNEAYTNGGAINIEITKSKPYKLIEIYNCEFTENKAEHRDKNQGTEYEHDERGGAIYFSFDSTDDEDFVFHITDCQFNKNAVTYYGGAIFLSLTKDHKSLQIEISHCTFSENKANNEIEKNDKYPTEYSENGSGSDIFYIIKSDSTTDTTTISSKPSLVIDQCSFAKSEALINGGSIDLEIPNDKMPRSIEIKDSAFDGNTAKNGGAIMISTQSQESVNSIEINNCTFNGNKVEFGGAIYYAYTALSSSSSSKKLLEANSTSDCSLYVKACYFYGYEINSHGGAIFISITNDDPAKPIEINNCTFAGREGTDKDKGEENGGAIYYAFTSSSSYSSSSKESENKYTLSIIDSIFNSNEASYYGGAIFISIQNAKQSKHLEISRCSFDLNSASNVYDENSDQDIYEGYGGDIYYSIDSSSAPNALHINECNFTNSQARINGGSIYLSIQNDAHPNFVEINGCSFVGCHADDGAGCALYYHFDSTAATASPSESVINSLHVTECSFKDSSSYNNGCSIFLSIANGEPTKPIAIEKCSFEASSDTKGASIVYQFDSSSSANSGVSTDPSLKINDCNFTNIENTNDCGGILLSIQNGEPSRSIEVTSCKFDTITAANGCGIYYSFTSATTKSQALLEDGAETEEGKFALKVKGCTFTSNTASQNGGSINLKMENGEPSSPIKIDDCIFESNKCVDGCSVYFDFSAATTTANPSSKEQSLFICKCTFTSNTASQNGGSIYLKIQNAEPSSPIKIDDCKFNSNQAVNGCSIYFDFQATTANPSNKQALFINKCEFNQRGDATVKKGGSICISIQNSEPSGSIEINGSTFLNGQAYDGGAIYYSYGSSTTMSKSLLEDSQNNYALQVKDCTFKYITAKNNGGGIYITISNGEPLKPIEVNHCEFEIILASDNDGVGLAKDEKGGSIYYDFDVPTSSKSLLEDATGTSVYSFRTYNCKFTYGSADYYGGAIYLHVANKEPSNLIEIDTCVFEQMKTSQFVQTSSGGSIYYHFGTLTTTTTKSSSKVMLDANPGLRINNCEFKSSSSMNYGGAVYLSVMDSNPTKAIEMSHCKIDNACYSANNKDSLYIKSNVKFNDLFYITECDFGSYCVICDCYSAKFEKCSFPDISTFGKCAILYSSTIDSLQSDNSIVFTIDQCNFSQSSDIDSLVYFTTPLSSKFSFTNNRIEMSKPTTTRVLGCDANMQIMEESYWYFSENYIDPAEREIIKTENAEKIPADCGIKGFICDLPSPTEGESSTSTEEESSSTSEESSPEVSSSSQEEVPSSVESSSEELPGENCVGNNRCVIEDDEGEPYSITLENRNYDRLNNTDYGAAIRLINHCLICKHSVFYRCRVNIGGGGIYISIKKPIESYEILLEDLEFNECQAIYGGAVYIYNDQEFPVKIISCKFNQNIAAKKPQAGLDENLFGGGGVYLQVKDGNVTNCKFYKNAASGMKIYNIFDDDQSSSKLLKQVGSLAVSINDCFFEADKDSISSIFYVRRNEMNEIPVEVKDCVFAGDLSNGAHHIDGSLLNEIKEKSKFRIKSCRFSSGIENAVNLKKNPLLFDLSDNKLNVEIDIKKSSLDSNSQRRINRMNSSIAVTAITAASVIAVLVAISVFAIKRRNQSSEDSLENGDIFELNMNEL